ncbi:hypothetical protein [Promicromonospora sukumoe]
MEDRPQIVCLCGSARFGQELRAANRELTLAGAIVLAPAELEPAEPEPAEPAGQAETEPARHTRPTRPTRQAEPESGLAEPADPRHTSDQNTNHKFAGTQDTGNQISSTPAADNQTDGAPVTDDQHTSTRLTDDQRATLGALHLAKIDLADRVVVVNPGGYVGESTRREIRYAHRTGKPVEYTDPPGAAVDP